MSRTVFVDGPAGSGKTSYAIEQIRSLITDHGAQSEQILVLVPQRTLGRLYDLAFAAADWPDGAVIRPTTLGGLARRTLEIFWPLVARKSGFAHPAWEPAFLTLETAQYFMAQFVSRSVETGVFDSVSITPFRIMSQSLDNLSKAAMNQFTLEEVASRLVSAWGDRHSSRPPVYRASVDLAAQFRKHCLENSLLDFSLQIELFMGVLLHEPQFAAYFKRLYRHLIADNLEENFPAVSDFIRWLWDDLDSALLIYDTDAGYRSFLGADPVGMRDLAHLCDEHLHFEPEQESESPFSLLAQGISSLLDRQPLPAASAGVSPLDVIGFSTHAFFPQMIDWAAETIVDLAEDGVSLPDIVVLVPFLGDALHFSLLQRLGQRGIRAVSHRPSRALRDEPAARAVLTFLALILPAWKAFPPVTDVADAFAQAIDGLDPVRARLLAEIVYKPLKGELGSFDEFETRAQQRVTYSAGEKYERLRCWLVDARERVAAEPPDVIISHLFGDVLSQPGFGFHVDLDAGRVVAEMVESARKFRQTLYPRGIGDWTSVSQEYATLVHQGLLSALYVSSWTGEDQDAVLIAPAHTFLMRNRHVDYQFWLDIGSSFWWERLEQPLTHPFVLTRNYPAGQVWTDDLEYAARRESLRRLAVGLTRRCRKKIFVAATQLSEQGYEQQGPLLLLLEQLNRYYAASQA